MSKTEKELLESRARGLRASLNLANEMLKIDRKKVKKLEAENKELKDIIRAQAELEARAIFGGPNPMVNHCRDCGVELEAPRLHYCHPCTEAAIRANRAEAGLDDE